MLARSEFELWTNTIGIDDPVTLDELYPLVVNLWELARQLEQYDKGLGQELEAKDLSSTATGE